MSLDDAQRQIAAGPTSVRAVSASRRAGFVWCLVHAVELHALVLLALPRGASIANVKTTTPPDDAVTIEEERPSQTEASFPTPPRTEPPSAKLAIRVGRAAPGVRPQHGSPPAAAASAIALPDVGEPLPVGWASTYPGGLTSSDGTTNAYVDALLGGLGGTPGDRSAPARLGGVKTWGACRADGVPDLSVVRVRALVRADGTAVRVELADPPGFVPDAVFHGATPCAMREHYIHGRDRQGRPAERWTLPFRVEVLGLLR
jgi:hypothetical protein